MCQSQLPLLSQEVIFLLLEHPTVYRREFPIFVLMEFLMGHPMGHLMELLMDNIMDRGMDRDTNLMGTGINNLLTPLIMAL